MRRHFAPIVLSSFDPLCELPQNRFHKVTYLRVTRSTDKVHDSTQNNIYYSRHDSVIRLAPVFVTTVTWHSTGRLVYYLKLHHATATSATIKVTKISYLTHRCCIRLLLTSYPPCWQPCASSRGSGTSAYRTSLAAIVCSLFSILPVPPSIARSLCTFP